MHLRKDKGFTLAELLIVVAIIAVFVAISIPIFSTQLHKAKVAADIANLRSFYAELQADYIETGKFNPVVKQYELSMEKHVEFTDLNGNTIRLQDGYFAIRENTTGGYQISYYCNNSDHFENPKFPNCTTVIG